MIKNIEKIYENNKKNGWVKIENFLSKKDLYKIKKKIDIFLQNESKNYRGRDINFVGKSNDPKKINSFHKMHDLKWVKEFSKKKKTKELIKVFLGGSTPQLRASEFFAKPKKIGLPAPIHQDNYYWNVQGSNALTAWIALSKSNKKNGGVFYFNGSHKYGVFEHKQSFAKGSSQKIKDEKNLKKFKKVTPSLKAGEILIHNCLVVHGSDKNKSTAARRGWTLQYKDKNAKYDTAAIKKYEKALYNQINTR